MRRPLLSREGWSRPGLWAMECAACMSTLHLPVWSPLPHPCASGIPWLPARWFWVNHMVRRGSLYTVQSSVLIQRQSAPSHQVQDSSSLPSCRPLSCVHERWEDRTPIGPALWGFGCPAPGDREERGLYTFSIHSSWDVYNQWCVAPADEMCLNLSPRQWRQPYAWEVLRMGCAQQMFALC